MAFSIWFFEWYRYRKHKKTVQTTKLSAFAVAASVFFSISACNTKPEPFQAGKDVCHFCKMGISDTRFGGELITKKGKIYKFDDLHCMAGFLKVNDAVAKDISKTLAIDFDTPNEFIDVQAASFVTSPELKSPMGSNSAGFHSKQAAEKYASGKEAEISNWSELIIKLNK